MNFMDPEFFKELLAMFKMESSEHIQAILTGMDDLESEVNVEKHLEILEVVHRSAHSLKGAARTIGLSDIEPMCQSLETSFSIMKREKVVPTAEVGEAIRVATNELGELLISLNEEGKIERDKTKLAKLVEEVSNKISEIGK